MTVKELIEKLKEFDENLLVGCGDSFDGGYCQIDDAKIEQSGDNTYNWVRIYSSV